MAIFKCKMCSGDLNAESGVTVAECDYCGTKQTLPKTNDENLQNIFNRANTLRIKNEFDKAEKLYEKIIEADDSQSDAYWGLILCKYGIEYVDDPATFKKIPTCHRASYDSIIADNDYKSALNNADEAQKVLYEAQAKEIDRIQKEILILSQREETYDVFICYKETDETGKRTQDSVIANDIYYQLTNEGFKVFYAAITLEGKLGSAYEPIIFAALNSAKVMLSIGTKPEYFNAVWVKNEWSRFLKIIKNDRSKLLIPCYKEMDAYDLPPEFAHLQAQDMSKIGFINDLIRGIKKVIVKDESKATAKEITNTSFTANSNVAPLLKRAFMFLEDEDWTSADEYCEKVLDQDPECAEAYLGKLMAELHIRRKELLKNCATTFERNKYYDKTMRFADSELAHELKSYVAFINERNAKRIEEERRANEEARKANEYKAAINGYNSSNIDLLQRANQIFIKLDGYKDSINYAFLCQQKIDAIKIQEESDRREQERRQKILDAKNQELKPLIHKKNELKEKLQNVQNLEEKINSTKYEIDNFKLLRSAGQKSRVSKIVRQAIFTILQFLSLIIYLIISSVASVSEDNYESIIIATMVFIPLTLIGFIGGVICTFLLAKNEKETYPIIWGIAAYMTFGIAGIVYMVKSLKKLTRNINSDGKTKNNLQLELAMYEKQRLAFGPNAVFTLSKELDDTEYEIKCCAAKYDAMLNTN